jgi:hypothetical protein
MQPLPGLGREAGLAVMRAAQHRAVGRQLDMRAVGERHGDAPPDGNLAGQPDPRHALQRLQAEPAANLRLGQEHAQAVADIDPLDRGGPMLVVEGQEAAGGDGPLGPAFAQKPVDGVRLSPFAHPTSLPEAAASRRL